MPLMLFQETCGLRVSQGLLWTLLSPLLLLGYLSSQLSEETSGLLSLIFTSSLFPEVPVMEKGRKGAPGEESQP